jgi:hypothetical protein
MTKMTTIPENYNNIGAGIIELLKAARSAAARNVNSIMTAVYWDIGRRIVRFEQGGEHRAEYGDVRDLPGNCQAPARGWLPVDSPRTRWSTTVSMQIRQRKLRGAVAQRTNTG